MLRRCQPVTAERTGRYETIYEILLDAGRMLEKVKRDSTWIRIISFRCTYTTGELKNQLERGKVRHWSKDRPRCCIPQFDTEAVSAFSPQNVPTVFIAVVSLYAAKSLVMHPVRHGNFPLRSKMNVNIEMQWVVTRDKHELHEYHSVGSWHREMSPIQNSPASSDSRTPTEGPE